MAEAKLLCVGIDVSSRSLEIASCDGSDVAPRAACGHTAPQIAPPGRPELTLGNAAIHRGTQGAGRRAHLQPSPCYQRSWYSSRHAFVSWRRSRPMARRHSSVSDRSATAQRWSPTIRPRQSRSSRVRLVDSSRVTDRPA